MGLTFEWDSRKALVNLAKHGISFGEASTVFADPLSLTIADPAHSDAREDRFVTIGASDRHRFLSSYTRIAEIESGSSAAAKQRLAREGSMKKVNKPKDSVMRPEYDFRGGARGKYADRFAKRTNLVRVDPDLVDTFPDSEAVNRALRAYKELQEKSRSRSSGKG